MPKAEDASPPGILFRPLIPELWGDLEALFGSRGACGGCWCMAWRLKPKEFHAGKGEGNRRAFKALVKKGPPPGVLAYQGGTPVGWCAVAPRTSYPRLANSRVLAPVDGQEVWSVTCLFIRKEQRRRGLSPLLLYAAADLARSLGARIVEGYPADTRGEIQPAPFVWTGLPSAFSKAGFEEVMRRSATRPIMRKRVGEDSRA